MRSQCLRGLGPSRASISRSSWMCSATWARSEGEELLDDNAAWHEATIIAGELFKDIDGKFQPGHEWSLEVTDEQRKPLYVIRVSAEKK
jgi:hypothetical protein